MDNGQPRFSFQAVVSRLASLPVCDYFPILRFICIENLTRQRLSNVVGVIESSPFFFTNCPVVFPEIPPARRHWADPGSFKLDHDWAFLSSLQEPQDACVTITLGLNEVDTCHARFPVMLLPFWHWPGIGSYTECLCFHIHRAAPARLDAEVSTILAASSRGTPLSMLPSDRTEAWRILAAVWDVVQRRGIVLEDAQDVQSMAEGATVLRPAALATRNYGKVLDMGLLMASLLDERGMNSIIVFTKARLYIGVWLIPEMFRDAWTNMPGVLVNRLKSQELALVDLAYAGLPEPVPNLNKAAELSEMRFLESPFVGMLDVRRALKDREERMGCHCFPSGSDLDLRYPAEIILPPAEMLVRREIAVNVLPSAGKPTVPDGALSVALPSVHAPEDQVPPTSKPPSSREIDSSMSSGNETSVSVSAATGGSQESVTDNSLGGPSGPRKTDSQAGPSRQRSTDPLAGPVGQQSTDPKAGSVDPQLTDPEQDDFYFPPDDDEMPEDVEILEEGAGAAQSATDDFHDLFYYLSVHPELPFPWEDAEPWPEPQAFLSFQPPDDFLLGELFWTPKMDGWPERLIDMDAPDFQEPEPDYGRSGFFQASPETDFGPSDIDMLHNMGLDMPYGDGHTGPEAGNVSPGRDVQHVGTGNDSHGQDCRADASSKAGGDSWAFEPPVQQSEGKRPDDSDADGKPCADDMFFPELPDRIVLPEEFADDHDDVSVPVLDETVEIEEFEEFQDTAHIGKRSRIDDWLGRLLDSNLGNSLLNWTAGAKNIELAAFSPTWLEDGLYENKRFTLLSGPELLNSCQDLYLLPDGSTRDKREAILCLAEDISSKRYLLAYMGASDLERSLAALDRKSRLYLQEGGLNILYLSFYSIRWKPPKSDKFCIAPLILLPVRLERKASGGKWTISSIHDEPRINLIFLETLRKDFRVTGLDDFAESIPENLNGPDIVKVADRARQVILPFKSKGWELLRSVTFGDFSFATQLMWRDLSELRKLGKFDTPLGRALTGEDKEPSEGLPEVQSPRPSEMDLELNPRDDFCLLPADSSQLAAIRRASAGGSFIMVGPPGTGKSQTIANIIAQSIADGKRVLFVAEKAAALSVVHRRLMQADLGHFCLELHSNRTDKADVVAHLKKCLVWSSKPSRPAGEKDWRMMSDRVRYAAINLDFYVSELHAVHPSGLSVFSAMEGILADPHSPAIDLVFPEDAGGVTHSSQSAPDWGAFPFCTRGELETLEETAVRAACLLEPVRSLLGSSLMMGFSGSWTPNIERELADAAEKVVSLSGQLGSWDQALAPYGLSSGDGALGNSGQLRELGRLVPPPGQPWPPVRQRLPGSEDNESGTLQSDQNILHRAAGNDPVELESSAQRLDSIAQVLESLWKALSESSPEGPAVWLLDEIGLRLKSALDAVGPKMKAVYRYGGNEVGPYALDNLDPLFESLSGIGDHSRLLAAVGRTARALEYASGLSSLNATADEIRSAAGMAAEYAGLAAGLTGDFDLSEIFTKDLEYILHQWSEADCWPGPDRFFRQRKLSVELGSAIRRHGSTFGADLSKLVRMRELKLSAERLDRLREADPHLSSILFELPGIGTSLPEYDSPALFLRVLPAVISAPIAAKVFRKAAKFSHTKAFAVRNFGLATDETLRMAATLLGNGFSAKLAWALQGSEVPDSVSDFLCRFPDLAESFLRDVAEFYRLAGRELSVPEPENRSFASLATEDARKLLSQLPQMSECMAYRSVAEEAGKLGLDNFIAALESGELAAAAVRGAVRKAVFRLFLETACPSRRRVARFDAEEHEGAVTRYRTFYEDKLKGAAEEIRARLRGSEWLVAVPKPEIDWLKKVKPKARRLPVRELLLKIPKLLYKLCPCLLMSPLSVAQYLPTDVEFDLVIFDEASQIPSCDAAGSIARGRAVVAAGDPRQLPPTPFFKKSANEDENDELYEPPPESVLDELLRSGFPMTKLLWHYRSRSESLITFSNDRYYGGELVTFPSPVAGDRAVAFRHVPDAVYGLGTDQTNPVEAKAVADEVAGILRDNLEAADPLSVGVVTFNRHQQELIEKQLDALRTEDPRIGRFFPDARVPVPEPVMVKNLENIQGDERDIVIFSIGYGPDSRNRHSANFGPLNNLGGERRLNVAVTRARREVRLFSSYLPDEMPEGKNGAADLKAYLEYAANGPRLRPVTGTPAPPGTFGASIAKVLEDRGWETRACVGNSERVVDLAVLDRDDSGRYLVGIEGDGGAYADAATAADREVLRPDVLGGLGWKIIRAWIPQWLKDPDGEAARLDARLWELQRRRRAERGVPEEGVGKPGGSRTELGQVRVSDGIAEAVRETVATLAPVAARILCREASGKSATAGLRRGAELDGMILGFAREEFRTTQESDGPRGRARTVEFFWAGEPGECVAFRERVAGEVEDIFEVAFPELVTLASRIVPEHGEDPVKLMGAALGLSRMGFAARDRLRSAWEAGCRGPEASGTGGVALAGEEGRA